MTSQEITEIAKTVGIIASIVLLAMQGCEIKQQRRAIEYRSGVEVWQQINEPTTTKGMKK